jgi:3D-(3,5/4)-trihydroxycyclohexane-1,2-dione acylhydrolase (decyclizing)
MRVLTDPAECGPVTPALPQDVQAEAYDYPEGFFAPRCWHIRRPPPDPAQLADAATALSQARAPLIIAGGGVHYALASEVLADFAARHGVPVAETQAGKGALAWDHPCAIGAIGVTGGTAANALVAEADMILAVGTRLSDFTTASRSLFRNPSVALVQSMAHCRWSPMREPVSKHWTTPSPDGPRRTIGPSSRAAWLPYGTRP